jgi:hypothetical protein
MVFYFYSFYFNRFEVNLANHRGDIVLHINPRLNDRQLVLNAAPGGGWGGEDRRPLHVVIHSVSLLWLLNNALK